MHSTNFSCPIRSILSQGRTIPTSERKHHQQEQKKAIFRAIGETSSDDTLVLRPELWLIDDEGKPMDSKEVGLNKDITNLCIGQVKANQLPDRNEARRV